MAPLKRSRADAGLDGAPMTASSSSRENGMEGNIAAAERMTLTGLPAFQAHLNTLEGLFGGVDSVPIRGLKQGDSENMLTFKMPKPNSKRNVLFNLLVPTLDGYPKSHSTTVWAEDDDISEEVATSLESISDVKGLALEHVLKRVASIVGGPESSKAFDAAFGLKSITTQKLLRKTSSHPLLEEDDDTDMDESYGQDDDVFGLRTSIDIGPRLSPALKKVLSSQFKAIIQAGYQPGFTQLPSGAQVISLSGKISKFGIPLRALDAWDNKLLIHNTRLVLLISFNNGYPLTKADLDRQGRQDVKFMVGLSLHIKPDKNAIASAFRTHSGISPYTPGQFESFSLADPLSTMLQDYFQPLLKFREENTSRGWPTAEAAVIGHYSLPRVRVGNDKITSTLANQLDSDESSADVKLPSDPLKKKSQKENFPLIAMAFLHRRFALAPWHCLVCKRLVENVGIRPYCCSDDLCRFQYLELHLGPSLEYEIIHNTATVDLLVNFAYTSAFESEMKSHPPTGMGLKVDQHSPDFDDLSTAEKNQALIKLINLIPPIREMKAFLLAHDLDEHDHAMAVRARKLSDLRQGAVPASAWSVLRWIVASNTSYLRLIDDESALVGNIPKSYHQFVFVSGAPEREATLRREIAARKAIDANAVRHPTLIAFHGSGLANWHSILRQGLHYNKRTNGRAFGDGVYFALQGETSLGGYAHASTNVWRNGAFVVGKVASLVEILNAPNEFTSTNPYLVVPRVDWLLTRYLLVQKQGAPEDGLVVQDSIVPMVAMDPKFKVTLNHRPIQVPRLDKGNPVSFDDDGDSDLALSDQEIMKTEIVDISDDDATTKKALLTKQREEYKPFAADFAAQIRSLPAPTKASPRATLQLSKEVRSMMLNQQKSSPQEIGFYFDSATTNDNLFAWIVEMPTVSFDPKLPLAVDMAAKGVKGVLFEVLFPAQYPYEPPFVRVIHPRLLPFTQGGGGHVVSGAVCMDLLTPQAWNPAYQMESVLLQIKMALSNLEPQPARLDPRTWNQPYSVEDAIGGFGRFAATHGWKTGSFEETARGRG